MFAQASFCRQQQQAPEAAAHRLVASKLPHSAIAEPLAHCLAASSMPMKLKPGKLCPKPS
eukprot:1159470-Pelagomonas_calceolata.AAC.3